MSFTCGDFWYCLEDFARRSGLSKIDREEGGAQRIGRCAVVHPIVAYV